MAETVAAPRRSTACDEPFLRVEGLVRRFGRHAAVDGLSFAVGRGEIFGLLGPNGAGKSTTFHLLTGLLDAQGGRILVEGREVSPTDPAVRERIGVVFQHPSVDAKLTALENLRLGAALHGLRGASVEDEIARLLDLVGLRDRAREPVERWSGGMRRRLELARVLLHRPRLLIMDEPGAGLDQASLRVFWQRIVDLRREQGTTILVTTHQPEEAEHCDRLAVLDAGRLVALGTPEELRARVGGDVVAIDPAVDDDAPDAAEALASAVRAGFALATRVVDGQVVIEAPRGHELIPRLVEALGPGSLRGVSLRRPTLGDVFVKLTGHRLGDGATAPEGA